MTPISLTPKRSVYVVAIVTIAILGVVFYTRPTRAGLTVALTATVSSSVSCTTDISSATFGTLTSTALSTSSPATNVTSSCNSGGGCTTYVNDIGSGSSPGLYAAAATGTPLIASASGSMATGTEGYGIQATTTGSGSGGAFNVTTTYNKTGNAVGGLTLASSQLASSTLPISGRVVAVTTCWAGISGLTKAGSYADTVTYSCSGN